MALATWLVKSEPFKYSWDDLVRDGTTYWDGVRNYEARNNLRAMKKGDRLLYYHSNEGKEIVGVARVTKAAYQDPTTDDDRWVVVDVAPLKKLKKALGLAEIKADPAFSELQLVTRSRLSVIPVDRADYERILKLSQTTVR